MTAAGIPQHAGGAIGDLAAPRQFRLRLLRPTRIEGRLFATGAEVEGDAVAAFEHVASGRARLVEESDLPRLLRLVGDTRPRPLTR